MVRELREGKVKPDPFSSNLGDDGSNGIVLTSPTQTLMPCSQETEHIDPRSIYNSTTVIIFFQRHCAIHTNDSNEHRA